MTERTFTLDGVAFTLRHEGEGEGEDADMELALWEIVLEEALRNGGEARLRVDEISRRLVRKGIDPDSGKRLN